MTLYPDLFVIKSTTKFSAYIIKSTIFILTCSTNMAFIHHAMNNCMTYIHVLKWLSNQHMKIKGTRRTKSHAINNLFFGTDHITVIIMYLSYIVYLKVGVVILKVDTFFFCLCWVPDVVAGWLEVIQINCCRL